MESLGKGNFTNKNFKCVKDTISTFLDNQHSAGKHFNI